MMPTAKSSMLRCALELCLHHGSSSQAGGTGYASSTTALANSLAARRAVIGTLPWGICVVFATSRSDDALDRLPKRQLRQGSRQVHEYP